MRRRDFIAGLGGAAAWPLAAGAQQQTKPTVAWLEANPKGTPPDFFEAFRRGLAEFGFSAGRDVTVEFHNIAGYGERLPALVVDVVRRRPAAIIAIGVGAASAAKTATPDIPIIFFLGIDPVELGLVASLNRPGGNLTGVAFLNTDTAEKRLELLHRAVPVAEDWFVGRSRRYSVRSGGDQGYGISGPYSRVTLVDFQRNSRHRDCASLCRTCRAAGRCRPSGR
jgi:putative tryptophan/tyrosine transport system substrate-binding protein